MKDFWLEMQWQNDLAVPTTAPTLWVPQGYTAAVDGNPTHVDNGWVWEWTITPQPNGEIVDIPASYWTIAGNNVAQIIVASKCVPEPSTLALLASMGAVAFVGLGWKRRRAG